MELPFILLFEPPTRSDVHRWLRRGSSWRRVAVLICGAAAIGCGVWFRIHSVRQEPAAPAVLRLQTTPPGAAIQLDGHAQGTTPAVVRASAGKHRLLLRLPGYAPADVPLTMRAGATDHLQRQLWPANVRVLPLAAPRPGSVITTAGFLADGRVAAEVQLSSGGRQVWVADGAGHYHRVGPALGQGALAISPDGGRVAYLTASRQATPSFDNPLNVIGLADINGNQLIAPLQISAAAAHLVDLTWAPDGKRLLIVAQQQAAVGGASSQLLVLSLDGSQPQVLAELPATVVEGSWSWNQNGQAVAFLTHGSSTTALSAIDLQTGAFRYLGDVARGTDAPPTFPPMAWSSDDDQLIFAAPVSGQSGWPFGSHQTLQLLLGSIARGSSPWLSADAQSPLWLADGQVLAFTRPKHDGPLVLRSFDGSGPGQDVTTLPIKTGTVWGRWDAEHRQALLAVPGMGADGAAETAYWLVQFTTGEGS